MRTAPGISQEKAVKVAGAAYFLIIISSLFSLFLGSVRLTVKGDPQATFARFAANLPALRMSAAIDLAMFFSVVLLAWALYIVLRPVNRDLALLALLWRVGEAIIGCMVVTVSSAIILLASGDLPAGLFGPETSALLTEALGVLSGDILNILMPFLCIGTVVNFYLFYRSRYIPRALSIWGMASCLFMTVGAFAKILAPEAAGGLETAAGFPVILFEIVIGIWLYFRGISVSHGNVT